MARPKKDEPERLDCLLHFRCSRADQARIRAKAKAAGMSQSVYMRQMALSGAVTPPGPVNAAVREVNRLAANLNQLMPIAHLNGKVPPELLDMRASVTAAISALIEAVSRKA